MVDQRGGCADKVDGILGLVNWKHIPKAPEAPLRGGQELGRGDDGCSGFVVKAGRRHHEEGAGGRAVGLDIGFSLRRLCESEEERGEQTMAWVFRRGHTTAFGALGSEQGQAGVVFAGQDQEVLGC